MLQRGKQTMFQLNNRFGEISRQSRLVRLADNGVLDYVPYNDKGDRIPDFSNVGYAGGDEPIPHVPAVEELHPGTDDDDTERIQKAIDRIAERPLDAQGFRGALLLTKGSYRVAGTLRIAASGIVLRGEGAEADSGTVLLATGKQQYDLIRVMGSTEDYAGEPLDRRFSPIDDRPLVREVEGSRTRITDDYVPVGARSFRVERADAYKAGDEIVVLRPSTAEWIHELGMDRIGDRPGLRNWQPGQYDLHYERRIISVEGSVVTIDAPIVNSLDAKFGGGFIYKYRHEGRVERIGIEHMRLDSQFAHDEDEDHGWNAVALDNVQHGWVRHVTAVHYGYSCVFIGASAKHITVEHCAYLDGISKVTGGRRYSFAIGGQLSLVQHCYSTYSRHDFVMHSKACGPNVFHNCKAEQSFSASEPHHRWTSGVLYDNVFTDGPGACFFAVNRGDSGSGHGWSGAQIVFWNCRAPLIAVMKPPTAQNFAIGGASSVEGEHVDHIVSSNVRWVEHRSRQAISTEKLPFAGTGYFESNDAPVAPESLYRMQLERRMKERGL